MFRIFDFLFKEEKDKEFGLTTESAWLQSSVMQSEHNSTRELSEDDSFYSKYEVEQSIVHTRQDVVLLVSILQRTNVLLRWIRFLIVILILVLVIN